LTITELHHLAANVRDIGFQGIDVREQPEIGIQAGDFFFPAAELDSIVNVGFFVNGMFAAIAARREKRATAKPGAAEKGEWLSAAGLSTLQKHILRLALANRTQEQRDPDAKETDVAVYVDVLDRHGYRFLAHMSMFVIDVFLWRGSSALSARINRFRHNRASLGEIASGPPGHCTVERYHETAISEAQTRKRYHFGPALQASLQARPALQRIGARVTLWYAELRQAPSRHEI
jgi:hypothetical protein